MSDSKLMVVVASTRPGRKGPAVASWFLPFARQHGAFDVELVDLAELNLPFLDEPEHPSARKYQHEHTRAWSARVEAADAFVFVTPEYNYGFPAPLKNALDFVFHEWKHKPVGFVSYGGIAAGTRSVQMLKQVVTALSMMPVAASVNLPGFTKSFGPDGAFAPGEPAARSAKAMLDELAKWSAALKRMRAGA